MSLVTQSIRSFLNGVSQAPPPQRLDSQAEEQINGLSSISRGLRKRPPSVHVAKLTSTTTGYDTAFVHPILRSATSKYRAVVVNGDLQVYDQDGTAQTVIFPQGKAYLAGSDFRAVTVGDITYLCNRSTVVGKLSAKAPDATIEAYLEVRAADIAMTFTVTIDGTTVTVTTGATAGSTTKTDAVASALRSSLTSAFFTAGFTFTQIGSSLRVAKNDGSDFTLAVTDGLGGDALRATKGTVQLFTDLPTSALNGSIVHIVGAPESENDDYYVQYVASTAPGAAGVWTEVVKPGVLVSLDPLTLPHRLIRGGAVLASTATTGAPATPSVAAGAGSTLTYGWQTDGLGNSLSEGSDHTINGHAVSFRTTPTGTNGTSRTISVSYSLSTAITASATGVTVRLRTNTGPATSFSDRATASYPSGMGGTGPQTLTYTGVIPTGASVELQMTYSTGATPTSGGDLFFLTGNGKSNPAGAGVTVQADVGTQITVPVTERYAPGTTITATLDGTPFVYTVPGPLDDTGATVATGLHSLINPSAGFDSTNPSPGSVVTKQAAGPGPVVTVAVSFPIATKFHNSSLGLTPGSLTGYTLKNETDGSSGTITANTATTITVSSLTGGADNTMARGDLCSVVSVGTAFVFAPSPWTTRAAGDDVTCPFPSLVGFPVQDVCYYENRLGMVSGANVVFSASGTPMRLFRKTATQLLADDPIDVTAAVGKVISFHSAVPWTDGLYLCTDHGQCRLSGAPVLTPTTVRIDYLGEYACDRAARPAATAHALLIPAIRNGCVRVAEVRPKSVYLGDDGAGLLFEDLTKHVPGYLQGPLVSFACDPQQEFVVVLTNIGTRQNLYVCSYHYEDRQRVQLAWSRWEFSPGSQLIAADVLDGVVGLVIKRADGAFLETITLEPSAVYRLVIADGDAFADAATAEGYLA